MSVKPTITLIPSAYNTSKIYSVLPTDDSGDFAFSRTTKGTRINKDGLVEVIDIDTPRLDYSGGNCPKLLLERQSTNLLGFSQEIDNAYWVKGNVTVDSNALISPSGELNADKIKPTLVNASHNFRKNITAPTPSVNYTISGYFKKGTITELVIYKFGVAQTEAFFDLENGTIISEGIAVVEATITDVGNGWYRCTVTHLQGTSGNFTPAFAMSKNGSGVFIGQENDYFYAWGMQCEQVSIATSYIPTLTINTETRTVDNAYLYNYPQLTSYPFTVYAEAEIEAFGNVPFSVIDSAANDKYLLVQFTSSSSIGVLRRDAATNDSDYHFGYSWAIGQNVKVAIAFINATSYRLFINGDEIAYVTSGDSIPFAHNDIILGQFRVASDTGTRNSIKDFKFYNQELTDTQMRELTS